MTEILVKTNDNKFNWTALSAIASVVALIITVTISSIQIQRSRNLFEIQFKSDSTNFQKQFSFDTAYLQKQLKRNDSINKINMDLTKQAINHDDINKSKIIPSIFYTDLINKHWNLKRIQKLLNEKNNQARIDYIFKTKFNILTYNSINNYDMVLAFNKNTDLAYQIIDMYNSISKLY
jgi:hypothetical protein